MPTTCWKEIVERFKDAPACVGTEIGVLSGKTSEGLLAGLPNLTLYMVDWWREIADESARKEFTPQGVIGQHADQMNRSLVSAMDNTRFAEARRRIIVADVLAGDTPDCLPDEQDFIFLDANHTKEQTMRAIILYWPKVKEGGILCGHDYGHPAPGWGVRVAVDKYAASLGLEVITAPDYYWAIEKGATT